MFSAVTGTKKCQDAEEKGLEIVNEEWVRNRMNGTGTSTGTGKSKKVKSSPAEEVSVAKKSKPSASTSKVSAAASDIFDGLVFAISGILFCSYLLLWLFLLLL